MQQVPPLHVHCPQPCTQLRVAAIVASPRHTVPATAQKHNIAAASLLNKLNRQHSLWDRAVFSFQPSSDRWARDAIMMCAMRMRLCFSAFHRISFLLLNFCVHFDLLDFFSYAQSSLELISQVIIINIINTSLSLAASARLHALNVCL